MFCYLCGKKDTLLHSCKMPDRKAATMAKTIIQTLSEFPSELVKTITCDRGTEFANWAEIEQALNCDVYFADPYCAWQKGSNENSNGLLREFYPKGRNLSRVSPVTLKRNLALINARPRKVLKFVSAQYLWDLELQKVLHLVDKSLICAAGGGYSEVLFVTCIKKLPTEFL